MIEFLVMQVQMGNITVEQIPVKFRSAVSQKLYEIGGENVIDQT